MPKYWLVSFHTRRVTTDGPMERFGNEAIDMHPAEWIYKMNSGNPEYFTLIQALPIDENQFKAMQAACMKKGTTRYKRPSTPPFKIAKQL